MNPGKRHASSTHFSKRLIYTVRLGIDVTPALRARIKVTAFERGMTVAELLRQILEREFPTDGSREAV